MAIVLFYQYLNDFLKYEGPLTNFDLVQIMGRRPECH